MITKFRTGYMDDALYNLDKVVDNAIADLEGVDFDTLVGTGFSGAIVVPTLARVLDKNFLLVRKDNDDSHHGPGRLVGSLGERWIFTDDFVSMGDTKRRVARKVNAGKELNGHDSLYVGDYLYANSNNVLYGMRWNPVEEQDTEAFNYVDMEAAE